MWYGRNVIDPANFKACSDEGTQCRLSAGSWSFNLDFNLTHSDVSSFFRSVSHGILSSERRTFS